MFGLSKSTRGSVYKTGKLLPIFEASTLLGSRKHQAAIEHLQSLSGMPEEHFKISYHVLVRRFSEYVQVLPVDLNSKLSSLLNHSLARAVGVLQYYVEKHKDSDPLKRFVLFSSLLLRHVSHAFTQYNVILTDAEGKGLAYWDPMQGTMTQHPDQAGYYKLIPVAVNQSRLHGPLSVMIAPELMSPTAYEWLTSDRGLFVEWLDIMLSTGLKGGDLTYFYHLFLEEELENGFDFDELPDLDILLKDSPESEMADKFLEWLNLELDKGEWRTGKGDDPEYYIVGGGLFVDSRALDKFARLYRLPHTMLVYNISNLFGFSKKGGADFRFDQFSKGGQASSASFVGGSHGRVTGMYFSHRFVKQMGGVTSNIQLVKGKSNVSLPSLDKSVRHTSSSAYRPSNH